LSLAIFDLDNTLLDCLFDTLEGISSLIRGKADNPDYTQDLSPYLTRIEHLLSGPSEDQADPFSELDIDRSLLDVLTEYEEHRLQENLKQGHSLCLIKVSFSLMSFDTELAALTDKIKENGEVISTLPGSENDNPEMLAFRILCGTAASVTELKQALDVEGLELDVITSSTDETSSKHDINKEGVTKVAAEFTPPYVVNKAAVYICI